MKEGGKSSRELPLIASGQKAKGKYDDGRVEGELQ